MMSSGASEAVVRAVRAAAADADLSFREDALTTKELAGAGCGVIGVRGLAGAFNLGKVVEYRNRALVNMWQQQGQPHERQQHFLSLLNSHLVMDVDRHPLFVPPRPE
jgi:hypothetical protein